MWKVFLSRRNKGNQGNLHPSLGEALSAISAISVGHYYLMRIVLLLSHGKNGNLYSALRSLSVISAISVGLLLYHAAGFSTKEYFFSTERTERTEIFTLHCGSFLSFLSFLWDFYYTMRLAFPRKSIFVPRKERKERKSLLCTARSTFCYFCHFCGTLLSHADSFYCPTERTEIIFLTAK